MYHNLFIHSCVEHLGCFHLLAIKNVATIHIHVQVSAWTYVFISLGYIPRCPVMVINNVYLFEELFSTVVAPFDILTGNIRGFLFLYILANIYYFSLFSLKPSY